MLWYTAVSQRFLKFHGPPYHTGLTTCLVIMKKIELMKLEFNSLSKKLINTFNIYVIDISFKSNKKPQLTFLLTLKDRKDLF